MGEMRLHLEPPEHYGTMLADVATPLTAYDVRWATADTGRRILRTLRTMDDSTLHIGSGETLLTIGVSNEELARGIVQKRLASSRFVAANEPVAAVLRKAGIVNFALIYGDFERVPNSDPSSERVFPGMQALLAQAMPDKSPQERDAWVRAAVYEATTEGLLCLGLDPTAFVMWNVADRIQGKPGFESLATPTQIFRSHLIHTYPDQWCDDRIIQDLEGGSGPENVCVHLSTANRPEQNAARLDIYRRYKVRDVILFVDQTDYSLAPGTQVSAQQQADFVARSVEQQYQALRQFAETTTPVGV